ncbi:hypothetical protein GBAR_LOCUS17008, partial [Geodia barretti]
LVLRVCVFVCFCEGCVNDTPWECVSQRLKLRFCEGCVNDTPWECVSQRLKLRFCVTENKYNTRHSSSHCKMYTHTSTK